MPQVLLLRGVRNKQVKISNHGKITHPSITGGAMKIHRNPDDNYHTNLGILRHSLKSLNISKPKHRSKYIEF